MRRILSKIFGSKATTKRPSRPKRSTLRIETLETRLVPANIPIVVNTLADTVNPFDGRTSLREAITTANARPGADVIRLALTGNYQITRLGSDNFNSNTFGDFDVRDHLTIIGQTKETTTILGDSRSPLLGRERLFDVIGAVDMTFINLALRNGGNKDSFGGAVQAISANIKLDTCIVTGNLGLKGGAINAESGNVTLIRTTMSGNTSRGNGGAINAENGNVTLGASTVTNSSAVGNGGGIFARNGTVTLSQSTVSGNNRAVNGAGVFSAVANLRDSTVSGNRASNFGGGVAAPLTNLVNSTVRDNGAVGAGGGVDAATLTMTNSTVRDNQAGGIGGGIHALTATLVRSTVSGNRTATDGAGIHATTTNLTNSTISGNIASGNGGGVHTTKGSFLNATIVRNSAGVFGGGVFGGTATVKNTIIAENRAFSFGQDLAGFFVSQGNNLIGDGNGGNGATGFINGVKADQVGEPGNRIDARLGALAFNGGPTQTHALLAGSRAIDRGNNTGAPATDQRGLARRKDGDGNGSLIVDIGAFER